MTMLTHSIWFWLVAIYLTMSLVTFIAYWWDKRSAQKGLWRTRESTLHMLELLCGWPGARLAQCKLRHKSVKRSYQIVYWLIVVVNLFALSYFIYGRLTDDWTLSRFRL